MRFHAAYYFVPFIFTTILEYIDYLYINNICFELRQLERSKSERENMQRKIQSTIYDLSGHVKNPLIIPQLLAKVSAVIDFNHLKSSHSFLVVLARQNALSSPPGTLGTYSSLGSATPDGVKSRHWN